MIKGGTLSIAELRPDPSYLLVIINLGCLSQGRKFLEVYTSAHRFGKDQNLTFSLPDLFLCVVFGRPG